jgi:hypothetical protein
MTDLIYGPQTPAVLALVERARTLTGDEITALADTWTATRDAMATARDAAMDTRSPRARFSAGYASGAAWSATRSSHTWRAARLADWCAARIARAAVIDAALALALRGDIPRDRYRTLTGPWAEVIGPAHPDDLVETPHD